MASIAKHRGVVAAAGVGVLFAVAIFAAVCAFTVVVIALVFPWNVIDPSFGGYLILVAIVSGVVVATCVFVIGRLGAGNRQVDSR